MAKTDNSIQTKAVEEMSIYEKMLRIQSEIPTVAKNLNVSAGKSGTYKAVSERDVKDAVKPLEEKYGVYSFPIKKELIEQTQIEQESSYGKRTSFYIRERVTYRFVNIHKPEEFIEIDGYGDGIDSGDKAPGKADTYASKYCLMSAYKISTGDDPDKDASQEYQKIELATSEQTSKIIGLYTADEIGKMLKRLKKNSLADITKEQAEKMIAKRDMSAVADTTPTF